MRTFLLSGLEPLSEGDQSLADMLALGITSEADPRTALRTRIGEMGVRRR